MTMTSANYCWNKKFNYALTHIKRKQKVGLLHGGGYDSTAVAVLLQEAGVDFDAVHVDYGQVAAKAELKAVKAQCQKVVALNDLTIRGLSPANSQLFTGNHDHNPVIEGRNLLLIMKMVAIGYDVIYVGFDKPANGNLPWPDCSPNFLTALNTTLTYAFLREVEVCAPFLFAEKKDVFDLIRQRNPDAFKDVMTCWTPTPDGRHCGKCKHCLALKSI